MVVSSETFRCSLLAPEEFRAMGAMGLHRAAWLCLWLSLATCQPACQEVDSLVLEVEEGDASESDVQQLLSCWLDCQILIPLGCSLSENRTLPLVRHAARSLSCSNYENLTEISLELWLNCGGDIHWEDAAGNPLLDLLRNREARKFWNQQATMEAAVAHTVSDWRAWVIPISVAFLAFLEVCAEREGFRRCKNREAPSTEAKEDPFLEGAKLLVSAAFRKHNILVSLWRFLEVSTCIFWFALVLLIVHWGWWPPVFLSEIVILRRTAVPAVPMTAILSYSHYMDLEQANRGCTSRPGWGNEIVPQQVGG